MSSINIAKSFPSGGSSEMSACNLGMVVGFPKDIFV